MDISIALGLLIALVAAPPLAWLAGLFNPIGYLGVPPWRVPRCQRCGRKDEIGHRYCCTGTRKP